MSWLIGSFHHSHQGKRWGVTTFFRRSLYVAATSQNIMFGRCDSISIAGAASSVSTCTSHCNNQRNEQFRYHLKDRSSIIRSSRNETKAGSTGTAQTNRDYHHSQPQPQSSPPPTSMQKRKQKQRKYKAFLGLGSNEGDSFQNIVSGLKLLCDPGYQSESYCPTDVAGTSFLYHTAPMYVEDQPSFWNGAVEIATDYTPSSLLRRLKLVEGELGRDFQSVQNGPRPLDLDILLYFDNDNNNDNDGDDQLTTPIIVDTPTLIIPHKRLQEREFVLVPLIEVAGRNCIHPTMMKSAISSSKTKSKSNSEIKHMEEQIINDDTGTCASVTTTTTLGEILDNLMKEKLRINKDNKTLSAMRLLPLRRNRFLLFDRTIIMGVLNITPDSFSDGGKWMNNINQAISRTIEMINEGANIVDIGGESTRPGATPVPVEEEIRRTVPIIKAIRKNVSTDVILSIDTRNSNVAKAAIEAGADIINDVSGGIQDPDMFAVAAELNVPIILMHMRGTPESMQGLVNYDDEGGVVNGVVRYLMERSRVAEEAGIAKWMQILDPGIGFAKDLEGNLALLRQYSNMRTKLGDFPLLLGTSRKGFIGKITGETLAEDRDFGTIGSCVAALCLGQTGSIGCNILRVHNVKAAKQAIAMMDAIVKGC